MEFRQEVNLSLSVTPPELAAAWVDFGGVQPSGVLAETLLGFARFTSNDGYVELGRFLLRERMRRLEGESIDVTVASAVEGMACASGAVIVYIDGEISAKRIVFPSMDSAVEICLVNSGFNIRIIRNRGGSSEYFSALLSGLDENGRAYVEVVKLEGGVVVRSWSRGAARQLVDGKWGEFRNMRLAGVPEWFSDALDCVIAKSSADGG